MSIMRDLCTAMQTSDCSIDLLVEVDASTAGQKLPVEAYAHATADGDVALLGHACLVPTSGLLEKGIQASLSGPHCWYQIQAKYPHRNTSASVSSIFKSYLPRHMFIH